ncbi:hypothetical protein J9303_08540 [Bacillaceae bacterium Marseille-Q3522]|nr:hypothetical protein [Bacillaceae bacterium Marseille-Q3522]
MLIIIGIIIIGIVVSLFIIPPLLKKKWHRELIVYLLLLSAGMTLSILLSKNIEIPNPSDFLIKISRPVTSNIDLLLQ